MRKLLVLAALLLGSTASSQTANVDWPTYHGNVSGNRYTTLSQITKDNVARLAPVWTFNTPGANRPQTTPLVVAGVMYTSSVNECWALDAATGTQVWHYQRPRTMGLANSTTANRGVAVAGDNVFMVTDSAHLIALNRTNGTLAWENEMADFHENYYANGAPLTIGNLVIAGTSGGEEGARGFLAAFDQKTGREVWRFWTVPKRGEPGSETWKGSAIEHGGSPTWFTGTYDPQLDVIYWPTGNPSPEYNEAERGGDNLYSCSILALDAKTGKLKWYYQFTPHDIHDWDAAEPPVLVDTNWQGQPRKLLIQANRNGFFYVLDRTDGKLLLATSFVRKLTWASGIGADGRPVLKTIAPNADGTTTVCPSQAGASNWFSSSFNPVSNLFYIQALEACDVYTVRDQEWVAGKSFLGGVTARPAPGDMPQKFLRAIDIQTGKIVWELPQMGRGNSWGGVLSTVTGLVFFGSDDRSLAAADATTGKVLWQLPLNETWKASPMTYQVNGRQYIAVSVAATIRAFALGD